MDKISASMSRYPVVSKIYFALALLGFVWSWFYFFQYFSSVGGVLIGPFLRAATANAVSSGVAIDACVTAIGFSVMVVTSATRDRVKWPWLYVVACFLVGVCVALPLYLGFRERTVMDNV